MTQTAAVKIVDLKFTEAVSKIYSSCDYVLGLLRGMTTAMNKSNDSLYRIYLERIVYLQRRAYDIKYNAVVQASKSFFKQN